jgi:hypothetical protein
MIHSTRLSVAQPMQSRNVKTKLPLRLLKHLSINTHGGVEVQLHAFLASAFDGSAWSVSRLGRIILGESAPDTTPRIGQGTA